MARGLRSVRDEGFRPGWKYWKLESAKMFGRMGMRFTAVAAPRRRLVSKLPLPLRPGGINKLVDPSGGAE
jgi:hypothetical protein